MIGKTEMLGGLYGKCDSLVGRARLVRSGGLWPRYFAGAALAAATLLLRVAIGPWIGTDRPVLILFEIPVVISAYIGGMGPALLCTAVITAALPFALLPPLYSFGVARSVDVMQWSVMSACGVLISIMNGMLHRARTRAEASQQLLATTIASIGDGAITTDATGKITFLNKEARRLTGWSLEKARGRALAEVFRIEERQENLSPPLGLDVGARDSDDVVGALTRFMLTSLDGRSTPIDLSRSPIRLADGGEVGSVLIFSDRTAQDRVERDLRESEEKYRTLFLNMSQGVFYQRSDGTVLDANPAALEIFGVSRSELLSRSSDDRCWNVIREDGSPFPREDHPSMQALKTGLPLKDVVAGVFNQERGEYVWLLINAIPIFRPRESTPWQTFVCMHDITPRKRAEEELRRSELHFRSVVEGAPDAIFVHVGGRFAYLNAAALELFGADSESQLLGRPVLERIPARYHEAIRARMRILSEEKGVVPKLEHEYLRLDGATVDVQATGAPFWFEREDGILVFVRNINEQKKAEAALLESEGRYRELSRQFHTVLEAIPDRLALITADCRIAWANKAAIEGMPHREGFAPGKSCYREWFQRTEPCEFCVLEDAIRQPGPMSTIVSEANGRVLEYRFIPVTDDGGSVVGMVRLGRDVTEHRMLESRLRQTQKLEAIGTLAGGIAHDFNNILAPILGYTEMALYDLPEGHPQRANLDQVIIAANRARDLVRQILAFSRRGLEQTMAPLDLGSVFKEALKLMRASLPATISIKQEIGRVVAVADATQVHQIIINLCTNAAHAMEDGGVLGVVLEKVALDDQEIKALALPRLKPGPYALLGVSDSGHGMDSDMLQRIFEPYFTTKAPGKGTGLGLSVVHGIVAKHGGEILVRSKPGEGTVFDVYLPAVEESAPVVVVGGAELPGGSEKILLVDDEEMIADMTSKVLARLGYDVASTTSPQDALGLFESDPRAFDLLVTDYTMPGMTGMELACKVRGLRPDMSILLCTGFSEKVTEEAVSNMGVELVMKPLDRKRLAQLVRRALDAK